MSEDLDPADGDTVEEGPAEGSAEGPVEGPAEGPADAPSAAPGLQGEGRVESETAPARAGAAYRVALDTYSGPLDLLLYLIRKEEVDIYDIPIARIAEQYQRYIEVMAEVNVNVAGEFLVMAATLMEIKSRLLIPREEGFEEAEEEDPRAELVRQLLEYKRYKDLARELGARAAEQALKFPRPGPELTAAELASIEEAVGGEHNPLEGVGLWELLDAFAKVLSETSIGRPETRIIERQRPLHEFRLELLRIVTEARQVSFSEIFAACQTKDEMIAMFMALLELVRLKRLGFQQAGEFGEIYVVLAEEIPVPGEVGAEPAVVEPAAPAPSAGGPVKRPDVLKAAEVLSEIEEEEDSIGRVRGKIDAALERVEQFLKQHHEQVQREKAADEGDGAGGPPLPGEGGTENAP